jgi:hypothetical protein
MEGSYLQMKNERLRGVGFVRKAVCSAELRVFVNKKSGVFIICEIKVTIHGCLQQQI